MFFSQWLYGETGLEEAFDEIGEEIETLVWVAEFRGKKNNALFVVPYIHFGPFGNLGGSEFTYLIAESLAKYRGRQQQVFVFHGTATHDFNPVSSQEIKKVVAACKRAISKIVLKRGAMASYSCRSGTVRAQAYFINDAAFMSFSRHPQTTEDVNFGLGLAIMEKAKCRFSSVAVVDEHNAETGDISSVEVGSPIGYEMLDAAGKLLGKEGRQKPFKFACTGCGFSLSSIGKNGIKLALFSQGKKMNAILLIDSNGILPEFNEDLVKLLEILGDEAGYFCKGQVMTTDTHQINAVQGVINPLGKERRGDIMCAVRVLFTQALRQLEEVEFGAAEERLRIKVFGVGQSAEIASTLNASVAILKLALPIILIASVILLLWALAKI